MKLRKHITISDELYKYCYKQLPLFNGSFSAFITYCICFYKDNKELQVQVASPPVLHTEHREHDKVSAELKSSIESILNM